MGAWGIVGIPEGAVITTTNTAASGTISASTINAISAGSMAVPMGNGAYTAFYPANYPANTANMVAKKDLSSDEIAELVKQITTVFPENQTLLMVVDATYDDYQVGFLQNMIDAQVTNRKVVAIREPRKMALIEGRDATTEQEKIDLLARIGVIWENNPGLTLAMIISAMMGTPVEREDEVIVSALELAWG